MVLKGEKILKCQLTNASGFDLLSHLLVLVGTA